MDWKEIFTEIFQEEDNKQLLELVDLEYQKYVCYPPKKQIFQAFNLTPFEDIKCVILGQDPYHQESQAMGLSFSVPENIKIPPSLKNIYKELTIEYQKDFSKRSGDLTRWANQGVLLLNTILTVRKGEPASHAKIGWERVTDSIIQKIDTEKKHVVFMLWGNYAKSKEVLIKNKNNLVLKAAHPSPLARGAFFGCNHFKLCNDFLRTNQLSEIDW